MTANKTTCSLSLDLDNQWSYMKTHGDPQWESFPSYLSLVVPRFLKIVGDYGWKITIFVVGQDAILEENREAIRQCADEGHEIGNHSFHHEPWLHLYSAQRVDDEIKRAEDAIESATGTRPRGFRGPGYSLSQDVLKVLQHRGYRYDASTLPTFLGPLARAYYFFTSNLSDDEKRERMKLFGGIRNGFQPLRPYHWDLEDDSLLEIPVTTMPVSRIPFHFSYLLYLATFSPSFSVLFLRAALSLCRFFRIEPSLLLHPLDFLGGEEVPELAFFPAMNIKASRKIEILNRFLKLIQTDFSVVSMDAHAEICCSRSDLKYRVFRNL